MVISCDRHLYDSIFLETRFLEGGRREIRLSGSVYSAIIIAATKGTINAFVFMVDYSRSP